MANVRRQFECPYCQMGCYTEALLINHVGYAHKIEEQQLTRDILDKFLSLEEDDDNTSDASTK